ncbi:MAG: 1-(5-phosphoribosyl)-5-[(5-phosphoribosylamino)methylideneamino] imidazole-4-carboxamide isomerase [Clostridia bacterium 41_269]|nr:MAG: 1-(5-phosphoribosyl)-5-[(5-phosphoribosylamino)methylideneamino] imidazole-4-carboxamide isomerase [Clostridia bacterium 41_269]
MLIIPAVDIRNGKCVRLVKGKVDQETVYSEDPVQVACSWSEAGASLLHLVDLDGAFAGMPKNIEIIKKIRERVSIPLQLGGGIRDLETISEILSLGVERVILGTAAVYNRKLVKDACSLFGERVLVGIDSRDRKVAVHGWEKVAQKDIIDFAEELEDIGVKRVIFTDTDRDGTLSGPNIETVRDFLSKVSLNVIVSGGISSIEDIRNLINLGYSNLEGIIIGRALYDGSINFKEALRLAGALKDAG